MHNPSYIEISRSALKRNLKYLRKVFGRHSIISSVVKGNAYGHGLETYAPLAEECGQHHFSVFSADEAYRLLKVLKSKSTIMIMGLIDNDELEWAVENDIRFFVSDMHRMTAAKEASRKVGKPAHIQLEIETGMNRTGFQLEQLEEAIKFIKKANGELHIESLCTHYAGAESIANYLRVTKQIEKFYEIKNFLADRGIMPEMCHTACSAAALSYPETRMDLIRMGIVQYGFWPTKETFIQHLSETKRQTDPLQRLLSWKSKVMNVKTVKAGEFIGYGTTYLATKNMKIAIVPVGYSHGFSRSLSNQGRALLHGHRVGVIGYVNMNLITLDVTQLDNVQIGDEVVLIGKQGKRHISVSSFSELSTQLNYELLTRLPQDIPRIIVD
jgi:alanine racemase